MPAVAWGVSQAGKSAKPVGLGKLRTLVRDGRFELTLRVQRYVVAQGWDGETVAEWLCALKAVDLYKCTPDPRRPGSHLCVYRPQLDGQRLYIKITLDGDGDLLILTFCRDGAKH